MALSLHKTTAFCATDTDAETFYRNYISALLHEIRNPLTLINSSLQIIEKEYPSIWELPYWPRIQDDIGYIISLLNDSSSFNHGCHPILSYFSADDFFEEIAASVKGLLDQHKITLHISVKGEAAFPNVKAASRESSLFIRADKTRLKEAVLNLIINAIDALSSSPVCKERSIFLSAEYLPEKTGDMVYIHVRDNGPGIPQEYLETIFDPFITHKPGGTGLGLCVVCDIVAGHNGSIDVETNPYPPDTYTDFCLCLPLFDDSLR